MRLTRHIHVAEDVVDATQTDTHEAKRLWDGKRPFRNGLWLEGLRLVRPVGFEPTTFSSGG